MVIRASDDAWGVAAAEVTAEFERYERRSSAAMSTPWEPEFWSSQDVVRFGLGDMQFGSEALAKWRRAQPALPPGRALHDTRVTAIGPDVVVVTTCFRYPGRAVLGRQSQTWARLSEGWRIVQAHVSEIPDGVQS